MIRRTVGAAVTAGALPIPGMLDLDRVEPDPAEPAPVDIVVRRIRLTSGDSAPSPGAPKD